MTEYNTAHYGEFVLFEVYLVENRGQVKFSGSADISHITYHADKDLEKFLAGKQKG